MISNARQLRHHGVHLGLNSQASNLIVIEEAPLRPILFSLRVIACHCLFAFWRRINFAGSLLGAVCRAPARPRCTPSDERGVIWFSSFRCYLLTLNRIDSIHWASEDLDFSLRSLEQFVIWFWQFTLFEAVWRKYFEYWFLFLNMQGVFIKTLIKNRHG